MRVPTLPEIESEQLSRSLRTFVEQAWPLLEPMTPYTSGYHSDAIIEALEAVTRGELSRVIINVPPRHGKSSLVSVLWLPWVWTVHPEWRWIVGSYSQEFASRDSVRSRRVIESPWYRERWGDRYQLSSDQSTKLRFENDRTGLRLATSIGGRATGEGADVIVLDDPHKASDAYSATPRENVVQWFRERSRRGSMTRAKARSSSSVSGCTKPTSVGRCSRTTAGRIFAYRPNTSRIIRSSTPTTRAATQASLSGPGGSALTSSPR